MLRRIRTRSLSAIQASWRKDLERRSGRRLEPKMRRREA
jgi:hypothetical protein